MRILVTGGSGMVGHALRRLWGESHDVLFASSQMADLRLDAEKLVSSFQPEAIVHLAARVGGLYANMASNIEFMNDNCRINANVLEAAHRNNVQTVVSCLSTCIFPSQGPFPLEEKDLHSGPPHVSNEGYSYAKRMLDVQSGLYRRHHGRNYVCLAPTNLYGPNDNFSIEEGHVLPALIHRASLCAGGPLMVRGSGKPLRQFLHVDEFARIIDWRLNVGIAPPLIICASEEEVSIGTMAYMIARFFGCSRVWFDTSFADGQFHKPVSCEKLTETSYGPVRSNNVDGLLQTMQWFKDNRNSCRT